ncbi:hypothetical protein ABW19_dt0201953 [Dactylella cylindrospora]|nr:hypothetical protein ABW19_dt0201953 [Dactylella cylindrospora]
MASRKPRVAKKLKQGPMAMDRLASIFQEAQKNVSNVPARVSWNPSTKLPRPIKRQKLQSTTPQASPMEVPSRVKITDLPLEILTMISEAASAPGDAVNLASACKSLRNSLGPRNRLLWYNRLRVSLRSRFRKFSKRTNYYTIILDHLAGRRKGCQVCLTQGRICDVSIGRIHHKTLCLDCKNRLFWDWNHVTTKYPEITFPETLRATCSTRGYYLPRSSIKISHAIVIIEEQSKKSYRIASGHEQRFAHQWASKIQTLQQLGPAVYYLTNAITEAYTRVYKRFHILKSPTNFKVFIEARFIESISNPGQHFEYCINETLISDAIKVLEICNKGDLCLEVSRMTGAILLELVGDPTPTLRRYRLHQKPIALSDWIKEYVENNPEKAFRTKGSKGRFTKCCFCTNKEFEDTLTCGERTDDSVLDLQMALYSRQGLAEHIFYCHNGKFAGKWEWCGSDRA